MYANNEVNRFQFKVSGFRCQRTTGRGKGTKIREVENRRVMISKLFGVFQKY